VTPRRRIDRREAVALLAILAVAAGWMLMPVVRQPQEYHMFADQRAFFGIPNAVDVLSNLAFVAVGLVGLWRLRSPVAGLAPITRASLVTLFVGLTLTGFGSAYYHLHPTNATLVWDRLPMTIGFAGVYGGIFAQRVSHRTGLVMLVAMLVLGPASVVLWAVTGDLSLYVVLQLGLIVGVLLLTRFAPNASDPFPWWALLAWYVIAKLAEMADVHVWNATNGLFAGHMLKHLAAALGGLAIANALRPLRATAGGVAAR
jgi:hypothetical protein